MIAAYLVLAVAIAAGFWRQEVLDAHQDSELRTAISCAFEVILAPFPDAPSDVVREALASAGFPGVTVEQCVAIANRE